MNPTKVLIVRRLLGLTQEELGGLLDCHARTVQNWEAGTTEPRPYQLRKLAELSEKSVAWFFEEAA